LKRDMTKVTATLAVDAVYFLRQVYVDQRVLFQESYRESPGSVEVHAFWFDAARVPCRAHAGSYAKSLALTLIQAGTSPEQVQAKVACTLAEISGVPRMTRMGAAT
jgi:hypothetical protein